MKLNWSSIRMVGSFALLTFVLPVGCVLLVVNEVDRGERKWEQWSKDHQCRPVTHLPSSGLFGDPKTGWLCDDGETYFRPLKQR